MSYLDFLDTPERNVFVQYHRQITGREPLLQEVEFAKHFGYYNEPKSELSNIYEKVFMDKPLTYEQKQLLGTEGLSRRGDVFTLQPTTGKAVTPPQIGPSRIKYIGLKKKKKVKKMN